MSSPVVFVFNTHGIFLLIASVLAYEIFIVKKTEIAVHSLFALLAALIVSVILKELYLVPRPFIFKPHAANAGLAYLSSFPSTHTALAFSLATTITLHQRRFGIFIFALASIISIGRVAATVHSPVDIAFGVLIGIIVGTFFDKVHFAKGRK